MWSLPAALGGEPSLETLDNGLTVCLLDCQGTGLVSTAVCYRAGTLVEPQGQEGIAHFLEHMMFRGSEHYATGEIDRLTLSMGGSNNAFTSHDSTLYYFSFAKEHWPVALSIEADRMRGLKLAQEDVATETDVILEEIAHQDEDPWSVLEQRVREAVYRGHGYGRPVLGTRETVATIGRAELEAFHAVNCGPDNAVLVVAGDLGPAPLERIRTAFAGLECRRTEGVPPVGHEERRSSRRVGLRRGDVARLMVSLPVPEAGHPDHVPLRLLAAIFGAGRSSRLSRILVEELQLCSGASCDVSETVEPGSWSVEAEVIPGVALSDVENRVLAELARLGSEPVTTEELNRARTVLRVDWIFSHERILERAITLALAGAHFGPGYLDRVSTDLAACGIEELTDVAQRYLGPEPGPVIGWSLPEGV